MTIAKVRRKTSTGKLEIGSVQMLGQRVTIRIVKDEYLRQQDMNRYVYEVLSRRSEFRGCVDVIFSATSVCLSAGHTYHVRFNDDMRAPRIVKSFREITKP